MMRFRWWLFKKLSTLGWWVCPEPHRTNLRAVFDVRWDDIKLPLRPEHHDG